MIQGVIFDLDGTLLNTLEDLRDSTNYALAKFGYPEKSLEEIRQFIGNGVKLLIKRAIPDGIQNPNFEECLSTFKTHYSENMFNKTTPYNGVMDMLTKLKLSGIQTAVVSNKFDAAVKTLCKKHFGDLISIAIGENEDEGIRKKPASDGIFKAINELKISIENIVYVGDSETDILTAKNAEIDCICCTWGYRSKDTLVKHGAKFFVDTPSQILKLIEEY